MVEIGVPEKHTVFFEGFEGGISDIGNVGLDMLTSGEYETLRRATRVVHLPRLTPLRHPQDPPKIAKNNILFVLATGNMSRSMGNDRDMYNIFHRRWSRSQSKVSYRSILKVYNTGKVIAATSARVTESGEIEPNEKVVQCGDIKESCFTMTPEQYTSDASARLSAITFYLTQFWETPEEVVEVLRECAIDVGEPGVDREYGNGIANLLCPRVLKKEVEVMSEYLGDTGERGEILEGGNLRGLWEAENTSLQVYIPKALKETLQTEYQEGIVNGTVEFKEGKVSADFMAKATVSVVFLLEEPIKATAEEAVQIEGEYTVDHANTISIQSSSEEFLQYTYTATRDSLHIVKSFSLNEVLALLPGPLGSMVDMASPDFFSDDPVKIRMSFKNIKRGLVGDFDGDGVVSVSDFLLFVEAFGSVRGDQAFDESMDLVFDGIINIADFLIFIDQFGKTNNS